MPTQSPTSSSLPEEPLCAPPSPKMLLRPAPNGWDPDLRASWQVCDLREVSAEVADGVRLALTRLLLSLEPAG
jgi:hypothetical protein